MTDALTQGAWGYGLATIAEPDDRVLDTWYPDPQLGTDPPGESRAGWARTRARTSSRPRRGATSAAACAPSSC